MRIFIQNKKIVDIRDAADIYIGENESILTIYIDDSINVIPYIRGIQSNGRIFEVIANINPSKAAEEDGYTHKYDYVLSANAGVLIAPGKTEFEVWYEDTEGEKQCMGKAQTNAHTTTYDDGEGDIFYDEKGEMVSILREYKKLKVDYNAVVNEIRNSVSNTYNIGSYMEETSLEQSFKHIFDYFAENDTSLIILQNRNGIYLAYKPVTDELTMLKSYVIFDVQQAKYYRYTCNYDIIENIENLTFTKGDKVLSSENADYSTKSGSSEKADYAEKAKMDELGNLIASTYACDVYYNIETNELYLKNKKGEIITSPVVIDNVNNAKNAEKAILAENANDSRHSTTADSADSAEYAKTSGRATSADTADNATHSTSADTAEYSSYAHFYYYDDNNGRHSEQLKYKFDSIDSAIAWLNGAIESINSGTNLPQIKQDIKDIQTAWDNFFNGQSANGVVDTLIEIRDGLVDVKNYALNEADRAENNAKSYANSEIVKAKKEVDDNAKSYASTAESNAKNEVSNTESRINEKIESLKDNVDTRAYKTSLITRVDYDSDNHKLIFYNTASADGTPKKIAEATLPEFTNMADVQDYVVKNFQANITDGNKLSLDLVDLTNKLFSLSYARNGVKTLISNVENFNFQSFEETANGQSSSVSVRKDAIYLLSNGKELKINKDGVYIDDDKVITITELESALEDVNVTYDDTELKELIAKKVDKTEGLLKHIVYNATTKKLDITYLDGNGEISTSYIDVTDFSLNETYLDNKYQSKITDDNKLPLDKVDTENKSLKVTRKRTDGSSGKQFVETIENGGNGIKFSDSCVENGVTVEDADIGIYKSQVWLRSIIDGKTNTVKLDENGLTYNNKTIATLDDIKDGYDDTEIKDLISGKANASESGHSLDVSMDTSTYIVTIKLKNKVGTVLSTQSFDLPLESVVVSGAYDNSTKKVKLTLKNGSDVSFSVADLVSGLQTQITSSNKLSVNLISGLSKVATSNNYADLDNKPYETAIIYASGNRVNLGILNEAFKNYTTVLSLDNIFNFMQVTNVLFVYDRTELNQTYSIPLSYITKKNNYLELFFTTATSAINVVTVILNLTIADGKIAVYGTFNGMDGSVSASRLTIDSSLDTSSTNPIQNKAVASAINAVKAVSGSQTTTSTADGGTNVFRFTFADGTTKDVSIKNGSKGANGKDGTNGTNGTNGVSCTHSWNGTTLSVTSASGTSSANLKGDKGDKGNDGTDNFIVILASSTRVILTNLTNALKKAYPSGYDRTDMYTFLLKSDVKLIYSTSSSEVIYNLKSIVKTSTSVELTFFFQRNYVSQYETTLRLSLDAGGNVVLASPWTYADNVTSTSALEVQSKDDNAGLVSATTLLNMVYPVGSIYMSVNNTSPATFLGGTWVALQDRFLLGAGNSYSNGATGGEATHTLTINEMPKHRHGIKYPQGSTGSGTELARSNTTNWTDADNYGEGNLWRTIMSNEGGNEAHNNMPPYLAVYMWKRTA